MNFGLVIIGDEILSGKRRDGHFPKVLELLSARGLQLAWVRYLGDDRARIAAALRESFAGPEPVFCCGGIGATPDDHTRQAAGMALDLPLTLHPEAGRLITERIAEMARDGSGSADMSLAENRQRLKMGEFPAGSDILPNPYNRIPGFTIRSHYFVPGFPVMAWPMIEAVLDGEYAALFGSERTGEPSDPVGAESGDRPSVGVAVRHRERRRDDLGTVGRDEAVAEPSALPDRVAGAADVRLRIPDHDGAHRGRLLAPQALHHAVLRRSGPVGELHAADSAVCARQHRPAEVLAVADEPDRAA